MIRRLPLEQFPPTTRSTPEIVDEAVRAVNTYRSFFLAGNWDLVDAQVVPLVGYADAVLRLIQTRTELQEHWSDFLSQRDKLLKNAFAELKADNSAGADAARTIILDELAVLLGTESAAQEFLDGLLEGDNPLFTTRADRKAALSKEQESLVAAQWLLATTAHRASVESRIYGSFETVARLGGGPEGDGDTKIIANESSLLGGLHDTIVDELFQALASDAERQTFVNLCAGRQAQIAARLESSALLVGGYLALLGQNGASTDLTKQFQGVLGLVEWIRRLSMIHAYVSLVRAEAATVDPGRWYSNEKQRALARTKGSEVPSGQTASIDAILAGSAAEGDFVRIEGQVDGLTIEDDPAPPKFSSFFNLVDLSSNARIRIRAHMFSLANNGLGDGAFVRLNGFVRLNPDWNNAVGIDIDRVNLTELRKSSWYDDVTFRVRSTFLLYPDGMNMFFTPAAVGGN